MLYLYTFFVLIVFGLIYFQLRSDSRVLEDFTERILSAVMTFVVAHLPEKVLYSRFGKYSIVT